jgi:hypothetical protein
MTSEFLCCNKNQWDPHPVNITNVEQVKYNYAILAESEKGPQIVEHRNQIATQFHIDKEYPCSIKMIENFVKTKIEMIQSMAK